VSPIFCKNLAPKAFQGFLNPGVGLCFTRIAGSYFLGEFFLLSDEDETQGLMHVRELFTYQQATSPALRVFLICYTLKG
jgi:hypothetical protein